MPPSAPPPPPQPALTEATIAWAATQANQDALPITIVLADPPFEWSQLRGTTGSARADIIAQRKTVVQPSQSALMAKLTALGVTDMYSSWLGNHVRAIVPASALSTMAAWPEVVALEHPVNVVPSGGAKDDAGYYGGDLRAEIGADKLMAAGYGGGAGGGSDGSEAVKMADIASSDEAYVNTVPTAMPGFETSTLEPRISPSIQCFSSPPSYPTAPQPVRQTHDTIVMQVMGGSIEDGQDPAYPGTRTSNQIDRSGIAPTADLSFYIEGTPSPGNPDDLAVAIEAAVENGKEILNLSWGNIGCTTNQDAGGINDMLADAFASGVLVVASVGDNNGDTFSTACNQDWPSNRTSVLPVGGLWSQYTAGGDTVASPTMGPGAWATSGWPIDVYTPGGEYDSATSVMLGPSGPGYIGLTYFWDDSSEWGYAMQTGVGSSFATPAVAGSAALLMDAFYRNGLGVRPNYWLKSDLMMLTDGFNFRSYTGDQTSRVHGGVSPYSGTGRLHLRYPADGSFPSGSWAWTWGDGTFYAGSPGTVYERNIPANVTRYSLAFYWEEPDETKLADIDVQLDAMEADGVTECVGGDAFVQQNDYSVNNAIHFYKTDVPPCAVYIRIHFLVYAMAPGQSRVVYNSDLWDSESSW